MFFSSLQRAASDSPMAADLRLFCRARPPVRRPESGIMLRPANEMYSPISGVSTLVPLENIARGFLPLRQAIASESSSSRARNRNNPELAHPVRGHARSIARSSRPAGFRKLRADGSVRSSAAVIFGMEIAFREPLACGASAERRSRSANDQTGERGKQIEEERSGKLEHSLNRVKPDLTGI